MKRTSRYREFRYKQHIFDVILLCDHSSFARKVWDCWLSCDQIKKGTNEDPSRRLCQCTINISSFKRPPKENNKELSFQYASKEEEAHVGLEAPRLNLGGRTGKILRPSSVALKSKNQEINRLQLAVKLPWAIFFESVDILS
ncbi:hypothetical protein TNCV_4122121 [Trichonephila clavipes]|nr:hypothetical protein TNCV_4122121 [Trichonephila clavipes]